MSSITIHCLFTFNHIFYWHFFNFLTLGILRPKQINFHKEKTFYLSVSIKKVKIQPKWAKSMLSDKWLMRYGVTDKINRSVLIKTIWESLGYWEPMKKHSLFCSLGNRIEIFFPVLLQFVFWLSFWLFLPFRPRINGIYTFRRVNSCLRRQFYY